MSRLSSPSRSGQKCPCWWPTSSTRLGSPGYTPCHRGRARPARAARLDRPAAPARGVGAAQRHHGGGDGRAACLRLPPAGAPHRLADAAGAGVELAADGTGRLLRGVGPDGADAGLCQPTGPPAWRDPRLPGRVARGACGRGPAQAVGGARGLLHPRDRQEPRGVPVRQGRVPRHLPRWQRLRARPGGECSPEAFKRLFAWQDPRTGEQLGRAPRQDAMPAWDLVLRPHKDVSILYALGDEATGRRVAEAHHAGVRAAVAYLDSQVGTRTGRHGAEHVQGEGLLAVGFTHRTSRAGDPLLHTHLIVTNRTQGPDGQWRTLDSRDLLAHRSTADAIYQAELSRTLGVRWEAPDRWGNRAIQGMPEELRRGFSKRHEQITAELQRQEANGKHRTAKLVQTVVHATRPAKSQETPETLYGRWQQEAQVLGYEPERLVRQVTGRERSRQQDAARTTGRDGDSAAAATGTAGGDGASADAPGGTAGRDGSAEPPGGTPSGTPGGMPAGLPERTIKQVFDRLASPEGLTEQASTFTRPQVLCTVGRELPTEAAGQVGPAELEALADRFLAERAVSVMGDHAIGERHYATPELLAAEQRLIDTAVNRAGEQSAVCSHDTLRETLAAHPTVGADQAAMVRDITQGGQGVAVVVGKAGTGKTYALGVARHAWQLDGYQILGAAPTGIATVCLDAEGFEHSRTVDSLLGELDQEHAESGRRRPGQRRSELTRKRQPLGRDRGQDGQDEG